VEIKSSKKKQEMKKDPVMDSINLAVETVKNNSRTTLTIVVALLVIVCGIMAFTALKGSGLKKAQEAFGTAMISYQSGMTNPNGAEQNIEKSVREFKIVVEKYKGSSQAVYSAYMLGNIFLQSERYDEAITWFNQALSNNAHTGFVGAAALEGLATCYESKGSKQEALTYLQKALADKRLDYRKSAIQWKIALLSSELNKGADVQAACKAIIADTTEGAASIKPKAENLLAQQEALGQ
jgi:tetratricopeptide (TPR) repeat protein